MRPMRIVVVDVDAKDTFKLSAAADQEPVEAVAGQSRQSRRTVPTQRSANAFACGARKGVRMISTPSLRKTSSKARQNLLSRSWIRKRVARSESDQASCRACWVVH